MLVVAGKLCRRVAPAVVEQTFAVVAVEVGSAVASSKDAAAVDYSPVAHSYTAVDLTVGLLEGVVVGFVVTLTEDVDVVGLVDVFHAYSSAYAHFELAAAAAAKVYWSLDAAAPVAVAVIALVFAAGVALVVVAKAFPGPGRRD